LAQPPKLPDEIIAQLDSKDWQARRDAVVQLGKLAEQTSFRDLVERAVTDRVSLERDVDVRDSMLKLLRRFGSETSVRIKPPVAPAGSAMRASIQPEETVPGLPWYRRKGLMLAGGVGLALIVFIVLGTIAGIRSYQRLAAIEDIARQQQATDRAAAQQREAEAARQREAEAARQREAETAAQLQREAEAAAQRQREADAAAARQREAEAAAQRQREADAAAARQRDAETARTAIIELQRQLTLAGFYSGPLDGNPGPATAAAIAAFQTRARLPATGKADDVTLERLKQVAAAAARRQSGTEVASLTPGQTASRQPREPGSEFKDCTECPAMIVLPAGSFTMGTPTSESGRSRDENPQHRVTLANPIAVGKYEVTFAEWDACVADGGCNGYRPPDEGWGRGNHPVVNVNWNDAQSYIQWLRRKTRQPYRLLSEAEWEYSARAATVSAFYWGARANTASAKFSATNGTAPVGSYAQNSFGLYDMSGNVNEWAMDCLNNSYDGAPSDGSAWMMGNCDLRALRGGAWNSGPNNLRSGNRDWDATGLRVNRNGFRVARAL
jgi:formylglycine-generating enzyme required for sulfatase activity